MDTVQIVEIFMPDKEGEMVRLIDGTSSTLKCVALLANGRPIKLEKDWVLQKRDVTEMEAKRFGLI